MYQNILDSQWEAGIVDCPLSLLGMEVAGEEISNWGLEVDKVPRPIPNPLPFLRTRNPPLVKILNRNLYMQSQN